MRWPRNEAIGGAAGPSAGLTFAGAAPVEVRTPHREGRSLADGDAGRLSDRRASALALRGEMKGPFRWTLQPQVVATLPAGGGSSSRRRGRFDAVTGASFESAEARVEGGRSGDGAYETLARVTIEGLDLMGLVTADRIVAQVRGLGPADPARPFLAQAGTETWDAPFTPAGTEIVNLRVLDAPVSFGSHVAALGEAGTLRGLERRLASDAALRAVGERNGWGGSTDGDEAVTVPLFGDLRVEMADLSPAGCRILIPELGVLHLGEYSLRPGWRRLTMVRLELKGRLQGELAAGIVEIGGGPSR